MTFSKENLYVFVFGPKGQFLCHEVAKADDAKAGFEAVCDAFSKRDLALSNIYLVGADGTNLNTGVRGGIIRKIEENVGHAVQWVICMLHTNELPLRHYFSLLDGNTTGPNSFKGPIGQIIIYPELLRSLPVVDFEKIPSPELPELDAAALSKDQQYLYLMCKAVSTGNKQSQIFVRKPARVHHARFMNLGSNCLRLYVSKEAPSEQLKSIAKFVMQVLVNKLLSFLSKT